jgi:tRNA (cmo5U34)-methyltransferase
MHEVKRHFEGEARDFDRIILTLIPDYVRMLDALVAALPFERTRAVRVIDLGCGTGTVARAVLDAFPNAFVTCVDVAANMIAMAQSKLGHHARANYILGDFETFEFEGEYDAVLSSLALHHLLTDEDKRHFYRRIYENLSPGGVFYNADVVLASNEFLQSVYLERWVAFMRREVCQAEIEAKWIPKYNAEDRPARLTDQLAWLVEIGFADIDVIWKYYNFAVYGGVRRKS